MPNPVINRRRIVAASVSGGAGASAEPELSDWVTRVQGQGSDVTGAGVQTAVGNFIVGMKTDGLWARAFRIGVYCGDTIAALNAPLVNTYGTVTDGLLNFVAGDYTANGLIGGAGKLIFPGYNMHASQGWLLNDFSMGCYVRDANYAGTVQMGKALASTTIGCYLSHGAPTANCSMWDTGNPVLVADAGGIGLYVLSRIASNNLKLFKNGSQLGATQVTPGNVSDDTFQMGIQDGTLNGVQWSASAQQFCFYWLGLGLDVTQQANLYTRVQALQTALGRQV